MSMRQMVIAAIAATSSDGPVILAVQPQKLIRFRRNEKGPRAAGMCSSTSRIRRREKGPS